MSRMLNFLKNLYVRDNKNNRTKFEGKQTEITRYFNF